MRHECRVKIASYYVAVETKNNLQTPHLVGGKAEGRLRFVTAFKQIQV